MKGINLTKLYVHRIQPYYSLVKMDDPPIIPHPIVQNLQDPSGTPPWFNRPQGTRRFFGSPPPGPTRSYWFEPCRDTQGLQGFSVKARSARSRVWMARKCRRNLRVLFLKLPRKAFRKNCLPNKMFPPQNKKDVFKTNYLSLMCQFYDCKISHDFTTMIINEINFQYWIYILISPTNLIACALQILNNHWLQTFSQIITTAASYYRIQKFQPFVSQHKFTLFVVLIGRGLYLLVLELNFGLRQKKSNNKNLGSWLFADSFPLLEMYPLGN